MRNTSNLHYHVLLSFIYKGTQEQLCVLKETKDRNRYFQEDTCKEQINRSEEVFNSRMYTNNNDTIFA